MAQITKIPQHGLARTHTSRSSRLYVADSFVLLSAKPRIHRGWGPQLVSIL